MDLRTRSSKPVKPVMLAVYLLVGIAYAALITVITTLSVPAGITAGVFTVVAAIDYVARRQRR